MLNDSRKNRKKNKKECDGSRRKTKDNKTSVRVKKKNVVKHSKSSSSKRTKRQDFKPNKTPKNGDAKKSRNKNVERRKNFYVRRLLRKTESRLFNDKLKLVRHERQKRQDSERRNNNSRNERRDLKL
jgi:hypothetical protein